MRGSPDQLPSLKTLRAKFLVDPEAGKLYWLKWPDRVAGNRNCAGYLYVLVGTRKFAVHRIIWKMVDGQDPAGVLDHINGIKSDNRIANLRLVSRSQNGFNRRRTNGKPYPKGVWFVKDKAKFQAQIRVNGKQLHLGFFDSPEEAHAAYRAAAAKLHGQFARFD